MKHSGFAERHPYWFVAVLEVVVILVYLVAGTISHFLSLGNLELYGIANIALTAIVATMLTAMGWWRVTGFKRAARGRDLWWFLVPFVPMVVNLIPGVQVTSLSQLTGVLVVTLTVGFVEEGVFRGLMLAALKPRGMWQAAIVTALLFGLTHALNALSGKSLAAGAIQIFYATAIGFAFAALALRMGTIWPLVTAHFLTDFVYFLQKPGFAFAPAVDLIIAGGIAALFTGYGIWVMRQPRQGEPDTGAQRPVRRLGAC